MYRWPFWVLLFPVQMFITSWTCWFVLSKKRCRAIVDNCRLLSRHFCPQTNSTASCREKERQMSSYIAGIFLLRYLATKPFSRARRSFFGRWYLPLNPPSLTLFFASSIKFLRTNLLMFYLPFSSIEWTKFNLFALWFSSLSTELSWYDVKFRIFQIDFQIVMKGKGSCHIYPTDNCVGGGWTPAIEKEYLREGKNRGLKNVTFNEGEDMTKTCAGLQFIFWRRRNWRKGYVKKQLFNGSRRSHLCPLSFSGHNVDKTRLTIFVDRFLDISLGGKLIIFSFS